jgi:hypothetical protein
MMMNEDRCFPNATAEQLRDAAYACRHAAHFDDSDWGSGQAWEARKLTAALGWSWDFSTWSHAADILEKEANLAAESETA